MGSHPVDVHVGLKLRARRLLLGLSQQEMAHGVRLTFQQVQKYERGTNRVSASRLYEFSKMLGVTVQYFFDGFRDRPGTGPYAMPGAAEERTDFVHEEMLSNREVLELVRAYGRITDREVRKRVLDLVRSMADQEKKAGRRKKSPKEKKRKR